MRFKPSFKQKQLVVFDLDGTLAQTKSVMDTEMVDLVSQLLAVKRVAVIGGGKYALFQQQLLTALRGKQKLFGNLFLFPTTATSFYRYQGGWKNIYRHELSKEERARIKQVFKEVFKEMQYEHPPKTYGKLIEDRKTQVTFSALGQDVVKVLGERGVHMKKEWIEKNRDLKMEIARRVANRLPGFSVHAAGYTSIDVTREGIDKGYGIREIEKHLHVSKKQMVFVGDALFPGGNDYAAKKTGVDCVPVTGPEETKEFIRLMLAI